MIPVECGAHNGSCQMVGTGVGEMGDDPCACTEAAVGPRLGLLGPTAFGSLALSPVGWNLWYVGSNHFGGGGWFSSPLLVVGWLVGWVSDQRRKKDWGAHFFTVGPTLPMQFVDPPSLYLF